MKVRSIVWAAIVLGIAARLFFAIAPGKSVTPAWGTISDASAYVLLANNVASGKGLSYCGMAEAMRPPLYPLVLAALIVGFGNSFAVAARMLQFFVGLLTAYLGYATAKRLWGGAAAQLTGAALLLVPTLIYLTGALLTESFATLVVAGFLYLLLKQLDSPRLAGWVSIGVLVGLGSLIRFNLAVLGVVAVCAAWRTYGTWSALRFAAVATVAAALAVSPWVLRNLREFHGHVLLSSQTGYNMVQGLVAPQGRALPGDNAKVMRAEGWTEDQIETNSSARLLYPDEGTLNSHATRVAMSMWRSAGITAVPVVVKKIGYFWFETDELMSFSGRGNLVRKLGVVAWWVAMACALGGWFLLRERNATAASALLLYAAIVAVFHMPFVMNTRLGVPFLAPLACVLLPGGPVLRDIARQAN